MTQTQPPEPSRYADRVGDYHRLLVALDDVHASGPVQVSIVETTGEPPVRYEVIDASQRGAWLRPLAGGRPTWRGALTLTSSRATIHLPVLSNEADSAEEATS